MFEERKKDSLIKDIYRITVSYPNVKKKYRKFLYSGNISLKLARLVENDKRKVAFYSNTNILRKKII